MQSYNCKDGSDWTVQQRTDRKTDNTNNRKGEREGQREQIKTAG